jgi:predicted nucleic acid-binding protein
MKNHTLESVITALEIGDMTLLKSLFNKHIMEQQVAKQRRKMSDAVKASILEAVITKDRVKSVQLLTDAFLDILEARIREQAEMHGLANPFNTLAMLEVVKAID